MKKIILLTAVLLSSSITSCKKSNTGGKATLVAFPKHHGKAIYGATFYVKFGAKDLPSNPTTNYDLKINGSAKEDHAHIEDLRYGNYYVYAVGYDSSIKMPVIGGVAATLKWSERKKEVDIDVPVSE